MRDQVRPAPTPCPKRSEQPSEMAHDCGEGGYRSLISSFNRCGNLRLKPQALPGTRGAFERNTNVELARGSCASAKVPECTGKTAVHSVSCYSFSGRRRQGNVPVLYKYLAVSKDAPSLAFRRKKQHLLESSSLEPSVTNSSVPPASSFLGVSRTGGRWQGFSVLWWICGGSANGTLAKASVVMMSHYWHNSSCKSRIGVREHFPRPRSTCGWERG